MIAGMLGLKNSNIMRIPLQPLLFVASMHTAFTAVSSFRFLLNKVDLLLLSALPRFSDFTDYFIHFVEFDPPTKSQ